MVWRMRYELAKQIPQLIEASYTPQLLQLQDRFALDSLYEVQKTAIANYWYFVNSFHPDTPLYKHSKNKLNDFLSSKSIRIRCMALSACIFNAQATICFENQLLKLAEDRQNSIRYQAGLILLKFSEPTHAITEALNKLKLDNCRLTKSLFYPVTVGTVQNKQTIECLEPKQLNQLVAHALELEKGIRSSALLAKRNPIVDNSDPIKQI